MMQTVQNNEYTIIQNQFDSYITPVMERSPVNVNTRKIAKYYSSQLTLRDQLDEMKDLKDFVKFIGLEPTNVVKIRIQSKQERFFKAHNYKKKHGQSMSSEIIRNDIENRQINFFDLKQLWQQRVNKLKYENYKITQMKKQEKYKNQQKIKQRRVLSAVLSKRDTSLLNNSMLQRFQDTIQSDPNLKKLRAKTARQIQKKQIQREQKNVKIQQFVQKVYNQKVIRSKILNQVSKDKELNDQERIQFIQKRWRKTQNSSQRQKGESTPSTLAYYSKGSQMTKQNSTKVGHSAIDSPKFDRNSNLQIQIINPQNFRHSRFSRSNNRSVTPNQLKIKDFSASPDQLKIKGFSSDCMTPQPHSITKKQKIKKILRAADQGQNFQNFGIFNSKVFYQKNNCMPNQNKIMVKNMKKTRLRINKDLNKFQFR